MELTTVVKLPSNGKFYDLKEVTLDMMDLECEKMAYGGIGGDVIDRILKKCVIAPADFNPEILVAQDRHFLLMKLRIHTYGDKYHVYMKDGLATKEVEVSLDDVKVIELADDWTIPEGKLPMNGSVVKIRPLSTKDLNKINNYASERAEKLNKNFEEERFEAKLIKSISEIDGKPVDSVTAGVLVRSLKGMDLAYLKHLIAKIDFGYEGTIKVKDSQGREVDAPVVITGEWFRPRFTD